MTPKNKGLDLKRELRAFPGTNNPWNLGNKTQSTTKLFQCTPSLVETFQKIADFHSAAEPTVSDDSDNEANRWAKAVVALTPILSKGINSLTGWLEKSRVKPRQLAVVATGEPVSS